jgi:hypothetical protein
MYQVQGHPEAGTFEDPHAARAIAWTLTPAGEDCPKILPMEEGTVLDTEDALRKIAAQRLLVEVRAILPIAEQVGEVPKRHLLRIIEDLGDVL